jgi:hypothetical protein
MIYGHSVSYETCFNCIGSGILQHHYIPLPCFRENMPSHFKVKEYCPLVFRNLRERFSIDDQDYKESMTR